MKQSEDIVAKLTLKQPGSMKRERRHSIAEWLRAQADKLETLGEQYTSGTFTARYFQ